MLDGVFERSSGRWVPFDGLSPAERTVAFFLATVNPEDFDGADGAVCLMGQGGSALRVGSHLFEDEWGDEYTTNSQLVAQAVGISEDVAYKIYGEVAYEPYKDDFIQSLHLAARLVAENED